MRSSLVSVFALVSTLGLACSSSGGDGTTAGTDARADTGHPSTDGAAGEDGSTAADTSTSGTDTGASGADTKTGGADTATSGDAATSDTKSAGDTSTPCGKPGDTGNPLGVGKYCAGILDCIGNGSATICSSIGDATTHFCTMSCTKPAAGAADPCGTGASCQCDTGGCGCTPNSCL